MILVDYSSILHRKIFSSISSMKPTKEDGKYITSEFIDYTKFEILKELFDISTKFGSKYGEIVICLDNKSPEGYWRKDVLSSYKAHRSKNREESDIDFATVWPEINKVTDAIIEFLPWRCLEVHRAEADDIILVIADEFIKYNPVLDYTKTELLIHSPDKDMIQAQFGNNVIHQYSALTNKWILPDSMSDDLVGWLLEHVCLGDSSDNVPKVVDGTEFTDCFIKYLGDSGLNVQEPLEFKNLDIPVKDKIQLINDFDVYHKNRAGERQEKAVYRKIRFGPTTLSKAIEKHKSLDNFLDSNPLYREHYNRNRTLVLTEGIPDTIRSSVLEEFSNACTKYDHKGFEDFLNENNLSSLLLELPQSITSKRGELSVDDFW